ncbi:MAG TPA: putative Ig domain-containing protein [Pyrinomonadaceae bacterium]|nr:putative Ig domain-containing protein [Pyrinomonadaceae bacterium]
MSTTSPLLRYCLFLSFVIAIIPVVTLGQIPDRNINMVSGKTWPGGDPFLQRQNEPSIAVSSRNPLHLLAGANDYRTVDLPGLPDGEENGDAWLGIFKSFDGGLTWRSTLLPGYPQDTSPEGLASPNKSFQGGADPTVRAGTNGLFYYSGIVFNRDEKGLGQVFVSRFIDNNNSELADSIQYLSTSVITGGTSGQFIDKPWLAVDIPRPGGGLCQIGSQSFPAGNVYLAYSIFLGGDPANNPHTAIIFAKSGDCGATWAVTKISESFKLNQGTIMSLNPATGAIYVAWRQFATPNEPNAIVFSKSTDGGKSFTKGSVISTVSPFDQASTSVSFRTNSFPTMTVDGDGKIYVAWAQRGVGPSGDARIVISTSANGNSWTTPTAVDPSPNRGHQIMPAITFAAGKLMTIFYDLREDHTVGIFEPLGDGSYQETRSPRGDLAPAPGEPAKVFTDAIMDQAPAGFSPLQRRHTIDVRASQADITPNGPLTFDPSQRVSQYIFGSRPGSSLVEQLQVNPPNLPMFAQGTKAFIGDYIDVGATTFLPTANGGWQFNTTASSNVVFHAAWTDNRDVRPPTGAPPDWTKYTPTGLNGGASIFDPSQTVPPCNSNFTGSRNQNIYTARLTDGLFVGSAGNTKSLGTVLVNGNAVLLQRAFSIFLQNTTTSTKSFRMTIAGPQPVGGQASFQQVGTALTTLDVSIGPRSTISRLVFVTSSDRRAMVVVNVAEISAAGGAVVPGGLTGSVILNPDRTSPELTDPNQGGQNIANAEVYNPDITTLPVVLSQDIANQDIANQDIANQDIANQDIANPDIANQDIANQDIANVDIANQDIANQDIANQDIANTSVSDATWTVKNDGNTYTSYSVKLVQNQEAPAGFKTQLILYKTNTPGVARDCTLGVTRQNLVIANVVNPVYTNPSDLTSTAITDPSTSNATIILAPGEQAKLTVRVFDPNRNDNIKFDIGKSISPVLVAHGANSVDVRSGKNQTPITLVVTTTMNAVPGALKSRSYTLNLAALGGFGAYSWRIAEGTLPVGLVLNPTTGVITGKPADRGVFLFTVEVKDSASPQHVALRLLKIVVS